MEVLYQPYYAYEEVLAPFGDPSGEGRSRSSMLSAMERLTRRICGIEDVTAPVVADQQRRTVVDQFAGVDPGVEGATTPDDSEERRVRAQKYFDRDLGNPTVSLALRAAHQKQLALTITMIVMASGLFVPFAMALAPGTWPEITSRDGLIIVLLSALTVLSSAAEYLLDAPGFRLLLRLPTTLALLGNIGMNAWVASRLQGGVIGPGFYPTLVVSVCAIALFAHLVSAIRRLPEHAVQHARASDSLLQEQRFYANSACYYATMSSQDAWRLFVDRVEMTMSQVSRRV
jgi:hypothetical protein